MISHIPYILRQHTNIMSTSNTSDLKKSTMVKLRALCKEKGIKGVSTKNKPELVAILTEAQTAGGHSQEQSSTPSEPLSQEILTMDCIDGMKEQPSESYDVIVCDPPYNIGKDFGNDSDKQETDAYLAWCDEWIAECIRLLKPDGTLYIYGFPETLAFIRVRINIRVRWLTWHYTNKTVPSLNFWQRTQESILCCSKQAPYFNRDAVREPYTENFIANAAGKVRKATKGRFSKGDAETVYNAHEGGALPRDVIKIPALAGGAGKKERVDHPTQKPLALCEKLLKACLRPGQESQARVLIPFAGSGSECVAAKRLGCNFLAYEINQDYVELSKQRIETEG